MTFDEDDLSKIFRALKFAAEKHRTQRRKGGDDTPYINHPISVVETLWRVGGVRDTNVLLACILHDTVEDTATSLEEIERGFGREVRALVAEVTDDKSLPKPERKRLQVERAPQLSEGAKLIRLADKAWNVFDVAYSPPSHWPHQRRVEYLAWTERVVAGIRGCNAALEQHFDKNLAEARERLAQIEEAPAAGQD